MPYKSPSEVAEKVKGTDKLSEKKRRQFMHVFNSCYDKHKDDKKCHMMAWGTVKKSANELADIVEQIPEKVALIEEMFGVRWNPAEEKFDVLTYNASDRRIIKEIRNAIRDLEAAELCRENGKEKRRASIMEESSRRQRKSAAAASRDRESN